jgi:hypothetical protein
MALEVQGQAQGQAQGGEAKGATRATSPALQVFKNAGSQRREKEGAELEQIEGSKSGDLTFVKCLMNPAQPQKRKEGDDNLPSFKVVGYLFTLNAPIALPSCPLTTNDVINPAGEMNITWAAQPTPAGQTVALNLMETAALLSKAEYAGIASGDPNKSVVLRVKSSMKAGKEGQAGVPQYKPYLDLLNAGSIKQYEEFIANGTETQVLDKDGKPVPNAKKYVDCVVKEEYKEKFGKLFEKRATQRPGSGAKKIESNKEIAAAFRTFFENGGKLN